MNLAQRGIYFSIGLLFGCFIVYFIAKQKNIKFPYGPNARTLSSILQKKYRLYAPEVQDIIQRERLDSLQIYQIISKADVDFSKSKTSTELPCQEYYLESNWNKKHCVLVVSRCDSTAIITKFNIK